MTSPGNPSANTTNETANVAIMIISLVDGRELRRIRWGGACRHPDLAAVMAITEWSIAFNPKILESSEGDGSWLTKPGACTGAPVEHRGVRHGPESTRWCPSAATHDETGRGA